MPQHIVVAPEEPPYPLQPRNPAWDFTVGPMDSLRLASNGKLGDSFDDFTGDNSDVKFNNRLAYGYQAGVSFDLTFLRPHSVLRFSKS
jgi:hypothetical protein